MTVINLKSKQFDIVVPKHVRKRYPNMQKQCRKFLDIIKNEEHAEAIVDGEIQGTKSAAAQFVTANTSQQCIGSAHFFYVVIGQEEELRSVKTRLHNMGLPEHKLIEVGSSCKIKAEKHLENIKNGCVYFTMWNTHRMGTANLSEYLRAIKLWSADKPQLDRKVIFIVDDVYDAVVNKIWDEIDESKIEQLQNIPKRDHDLDDLLNTHADKWTHLFRIAGTWTSMIDSHFPDHYIWIEPPMNYTDDIRQATVVGGSNTFRTSKDKVDVSRTGDYPTIYNDPGVHDFLVEGEHFLSSDTCIMGVRLGSSDTLQVYETAVGTARSIAEQGEEHGVMVVAGTIYDVENRLLIKGTTEDRYYDVRWVDDKPVVIALDDTAGYQGALQLMVDKYNKVILMNQFSLFDQAKSICTEDGKTPMTAFYCPSLERVASDKVVQIVQRLAGTYSCPSPRWLLCNDAVWKTYQDSLADRNKVRSCMQNVAGEWQLPETKRIWKSATALWQYRTKDLKLHRKQFSKADQCAFTPLRKTSKVNSFDSIEKFKEQHPTAEPGTIYVNIPNFEEYEDPTGKDRVTRTKFTKYFFKNADNAYLWEGKERIKLELENILNDWREGDTLRNITKYMSQYDGKDLRAVGSEAFTRISLSWGATGLTIVASKLPQQELIEKYSDHYFTHTHSGGVEEYGLPNADKMYERAVQSA